jgi:class 3 adenylate cyclase
MEALSSFGASWTRFAAPSRCKTALKDRRIEFRVGIHVGDVVEESDGDLMGDGVNIAARLEGVARPERSAFRSKPTGR